MKRIIVYLLIVSALLSGCSSTAPQVETTPQKPAASSRKETSISMKSTPNSTCFSAIGYDSNSETLQVTFRDSGKTYQYLAFPRSEWNDFKDQKSLGTYYNSYIKGKYTSVKIG